MNNVNDQDYPRALAALDRAVASSLAHQVLDEARTDHGGYYSDDLGFASPSHVGNARFIMTLGLAYGSPDSSWHLSADVRRRLLLALRFQSRCRRPSGLIDIPFTNFDSPPDTAFAVSQIARAAWAIRNDPGSRGDRELDDAFGTFLLPSGQAVASGGFHTPNHRWVVVAALAQAGELYPELGVAEAIGRYLAEGIDVNADGQYSERSSGGYDAVCDQHLILAALSLRDPALLEPVRRNLRYVSRLLRADLSVVTSLSLRQDRGKRIVPVQAADSYYFMARLDRDPELGAVAAALLATNGFDSPNLVYYFARHPEWRASPIPASKVPDDYSLLMEHSGIWRVRRGELDATLATGVTDCFSVTYGRAQLAALRLHCPYFAGAKFRGTRLSLDSSGARLELESEFLLAELPGYWLPIGRRVEQADLPYARLDARAVIPRPRFTFVLAVKEIAGGFSLHLETREGMSAVPFLAELLFSVPGTVETADLSVAARAGQTLILKSGYVTYREGEHALTVGPGFYGHRNVDPPGLEGYERCFRVVMTDWTPVSRELELRYGAFRESEGPCSSGKGPASLSLGPANSGSGR